MQTFCLVYIRYSPGPFAFTVEPSKPCITYFGFQWGGWFFVRECIPFGWKSSVYIYHTTGLVASHRLWSWNIPSSLYIDNRHNGQLSFPGVTLPSAYQTLASGDEVNFALALAGIFLTSYILTSLGYFIGLARSKLTPKKRSLTLVLSSIRSYRLLLCYLSKRKSFFVPSRGHCLATLTDKNMDINRLKNFVSAFQHASQFLFTSL